MTEVTTVELKSFPAEYKVDVDKGEFEGYASVFGFKDSWGDIVERGAFRKTLQEGSARVKVLWQHSWYEPIGKPLHMEEDSKGLFTRSKIAPTAIGKDALILMKEGVITELSIGYDSVKWSYDEQTETRHLQEVRLWEYSPVTFAANELATITGVKTLDEIRPLLQKMQGLQMLLKEGRVLSKANIKLVKDAIAALQALLEAAEDDDEPGKSTHPAGGAKGAATNDDEPGDHLSDEEKALLSDVLGTVRGFVKQESILHDLRSFGAALRKGE